MTTAYVPTPATTSVVAVQFGATSTGPHNFVKAALIVAGGAAVSFANKSIVWGMPFPAVVVSGVAAGPDTTVGVIVDDVVCLLAPEPESDTW